MQGNLIIFQILLPIFFAIISTLIAHNRTAQIITIACSSTNLILLYFTPHDEQSSYYLGNISGQFGIELQLSPLSFIFLLLINVIFLSIHIYKFNFNNIKYTLNILFLIMQAGFCGVLLSADIFNLFVFLELSSIASYALCASVIFTKQKLKIIFIYLIYSSIAISLYLIGTAFIYDACGTLNIDIIKTLYKPEMAVNFIIAGLFMLSGVFLKFGLAPTHKYLINTYEAVPTYITAVFSGIISKINLFLLIIVADKIIPISFNWQGNWNLLNNAILLIGLLSIIYFAFLASFKRNLTNKQILIYSSFSQIGYILVSFSLRPFIGTTLLILFTINHSIAKTGLLLIDDYDSGKMHRLIGLKRFIKNTFFCIFLASILGFPLSMGFIAKAKLIKILFELAETSALAYIIFALLLIGILLSTLYCVKLFTNYYADTRSEKIITVGNQASYIGIITSLGVLMISLAFAYARLVS